MSDKPTVLIVDDSACLNASALFGPDYHVCFAPDGAAAWRFLQSEPAVEIALINLEASAEEGFALAAAIRKREDVSDAAIGLCLDIQDEAAIERALALVDEVIQRPLRPSMLNHHAGKLQKLQASRLTTGDKCKLHQLDSLIDSLSTGVGVFEYTGGMLRTLFANPALLQGAQEVIDLAALYGEDVFSLLPPTEAMAIRHAVEDFLNSGVPIDIPLQLNGSNIATALRLWALPIRYPGRGTPVFLASFTDISNQCRAEQALKESGRRLQSLMDAIPGGIALYDLSDKPKLLYSNEALRAMSGYNAEEYSRLMDADYHRLVDSRDHALMDGMIASYREQPQRMEETFRIITRENEVRWIRISVAPFGDGRLCNAIFIDVTHDKEIEFKNDRMRSELYYRAEYDVLTGIHNRETFYRKTGELLHANPDTPYVILMMDIDRFKVVNDLFGKDVGDRILIAIAHGLEHLLYGVGTFARMEADHFAACFPQRLMDMERVQRLFEIGLRRQQIDYHIQLSFGVYSIRNIHVPVHHMCDRAMMALKSIKGNVVQRYAFYDDQLRQTLLDENAILTEMNDALVQGQFVAYLQPVFTVDTLHPVSAEVLVRWQHPTRGLIPPAQFVPLFERNGFITRLDFYIWEQACALLSRWKTVGYSLPVSVNISRIDLYSPHLCERLLELTAKYGVPPSQLRLEITESAYSTDPDDLVETINRLRANGFMILMDDFGSGYSSLNVLMDMPVDMLKLDMRFLEKLDTNPRAASILTSVVRMAKWLHMPVVAEGVSTQAQLSFLRSIGCDHVQGYLFARPMTAEEYAARYITPERDMPEPFASVTGGGVDLACLWDINAQTNALFNGMIGAMGVYELYGDTLEVRRVNDGYYELFGCTPKQVFDGEQEALFTVHPNDRDALLATCRKAALTGRVERCACRHIHRRNGNNMWLEARLRFLGKAGANQVFCFTFADVTEQKEFEQARALRNYAMVLRSIYSTVLELNITRGHYRAVCTTEGLTPESAPEKPLEKLSQRLSLHVPETDDELLHRIFESGYLRQKLQDAPSGYYTVERKITTCSGQRRWASFTFLHLPVDTADEAYLLCIADVDSHRHAEELLIENRFLQVKQQEQARYQQLLEHLGTSLMEWDLLVGKVITSRGFDRYAASAFDFRLLTSYKDLECYIYAQDLNVFRHFVNDMIAHNSGAVTLRLLETDGRAAWCRVLCNIITDESGHAVRCIAAINHIDDQIKVRENYLDEQTRFQTFADNFLVGLGIFEMQGETQRILYLSDGYRKMIGYGQGERFYDAEQAFSSIHPDDVPRFVEATLNLVRTHQPYTIEYRVFHKSGRVLWLRSQNSVYPGPSTGTARIFAVIQDITELHAMQNHMDSLLAMLPFGVGVYDLTETPQVCYESRRMAAILNGNGQPMVTDGETSQALTAEALLTQIAQRSHEGHSESDERVMLRRRNGETVRVRLLSSAIQHEKTLHCYCAMVEVADPAPNAPEQKPARA